MACPIHVWVPLMAATAPLAAAARHKVKAMFYRAPAETEAPRELKRWAPVGQTSSTPPTNEPVS